MSMLDEARKQINEIDAQMAELFEQRMHAVEDVIAYKQGTRKSGHRTESGTDTG